MCLWNWARAARSTSPISLVVGLSFLKYAPSPSSQRWLSQSQKSFLVSSCWWISMPHIIS